MKVRLVSKAYRNAINRIRAAHPEGFANPQALKRQVSLEAIIAFHLDSEPDAVRCESRWCCPFHHDTNPSLWAHDNHQGTGIGRWGCNPCGISGDVYDFLERLHGYSQAEAIRWVTVWRNNHRGRIRNRLRSSSAAVDRRRP